MGKAAIQLKIMPSSLEIYLNQLKEKVSKKIESWKGVINNIKEEPIAFGLKALIITLAWPEEQGTDKLESELSIIEGISSSQIIDYRRAFG